MAQQGQNYFCLPAINRSKCAKPIFIPAIGRCLNCSVSRAKLTDARRCVESFIRFSTQNRSIFNLPTWNGCRKVESSLLSAAKFEYIEEENETVIRLLVVNRFEAKRNRKRSRIAFHSVTDIGPNPVDRVRRLLSASRFFF